MTTLRGKQHEICLSDDNKYFYSYTGLRQNYVLYLNLFDCMVHYAIMLQQHVMENVMVNLYLIRFLLLLQF